MGFVNYEPFIRFRQLTKLSRPGGRVSDRVTRSRVHALPILYREGPKHMCTCALSTVGRSGIPRRFTRSRRFGSNRWLAEVDIDGYDRLRDRQRIITAHAIAARAAYAEVVAVRSAHQ